MAQPTLFDDLTPWGETIEEYAAYENSPEGESLRNALQWRIDLMSQAAYETYPPERIADLEKLIHPQEEPYR